MHARGGGGRHDNAATNKINQAYRSFKLIAFILTSDQVFGRRFIPFSRNKTPDHRFRLFGLFSSWNVKRWNSSWHVHDLHKTYWYFLHPGSVHQNVKILFGWCTCRAVVLLSGECKTQTSDYGSGQNTMELLLWLPIHWAVRFRSNKYRAEMRVSCKQTQKKHFPVSFP